MFALCSAYEDYNLLLVVERYLEVDEVTMSIGYSYEYIIFARLGG